MLAVDLRSDPPLFDEDDKMPHPKEVLKLYGSLIQMDRNTQARNSFGKVGGIWTITAAHASVVHFLKARPVLTGLQTETSFIKEAVHLEMAEICVTYLLHLVESNVSLNEDNIKDYPLARLSA